MASVQAELTDFDACMKDADNAWADIEDGISDFSEAKNYKSGIKHLGSAMVS